MKTWKQCAIIVILLIIAFAFTTCDDGKNDDPKNQNVTLTNLFNEGYTATVTGFLTDTQWNGIAAKIENALNGAFTAGSNSVKGRFRNVFENNNVVIIVEKTTEYGFWKVLNGSFSTLYLNVDNINNLLEVSALPDNNDGLSRIACAIAYMNAEQPMME